MIVRRLFRSACFVLVMACLLPTGLMAQAGTGLSGFENICLAEARRAEVQHGVPSGLLQSIARVEAGRKTVTGEFMPWAWTLNDAGEGLFFDTRNAALTYLEDAVTDPEHSVDVGCMQVNSKWHLEGFLNVGDMLDPSQNADYAAIFLLDLKAAHGSWDDAVKHYHSALPEKNIAYHRRVLSELESYLASASSVTSGTSPDAGESSTTVPVPEPIPSVAPTEVGAAGMGMTPSVPATSDAEDPRIVSSVADNAVADPVAAPSAPAPLPAIKKQPNLAGQWDRVEHFRDLLAREAG